MTAVAMSLFSSRSVGLLRVLSQLRLLNTSCGVSSSSDVNGPKTPRITTHYSVVSREGDPRWKGECTLHICSNVHVILAASRYGASSSFLLSSDVEMS